MSFDLVNIFEQNPYRKLDSAEQKSNLDSST